MPLDRSGSLGSSRSRSAPPRYPRCACRVGMLGCAAGVVQRGGDQVDVGLGGASGSECIASGRVTDAGSGFAELKVVEDVLHGRREPVEVLTATSSCRLPRYAASGRSRTGLVVTGTPQTAPSDDGVARELAVAQGEAMQLRSPAAALGARVYYTIRPTDGVVGRAPVKAVDPRKHISRACGVMEQGERQFRHQGACRVGPPLDGASASAAAGWVARRNAANCIRSTQCSRS